MQHLMSYAVTMRQRFCEHAAGQVFKSHMPSNRPIAADIIIRMGTPTTWRLFSAFEDSSFYGDLGERNDVIRKARHIGWNSTELDNTSHESNIYRHQGLSCRTCSC